MTALWPSRPILLAGSALLLAHFAALGAELADAAKLKLALVLVEGAVYAAAALAVLTTRNRAGLMFVVAVAVVLRFSLLPLEPYHSTDIYRYIWDGRVQGAGINPYLFVPADPALAPLRDAAIWPSINRADYATTIYPPGGQILFFLVTRVSESVTGMKAALLLLEAAGVYALWRLLRLEDQPAPRLLLYLWHPLPVWEIAEAGHVDAAVVAAVVLAVLASRRGSDALAGALLAAGALVKLFPIVLLPALWHRWDWRLPAAFTAVVVAAYLPYLDAGWAVLGFVPGYVAEEGLQDGSGLWLLAVVRERLGFEMPALAYVAVAAAVMAGTALWVMLRLPAADRPVRGGLALVAATMLVITPHFPWYFVWLVPFLCLRPYWPFLWLTLVSPILYWDNARFVFWMGTLVYGGTALLVALDLARRPRSPASFRPEGTP